MTRISVLAIVVGACMLTVCGCTQGPNRAALAERIKTLETKMTRLNEDLRSVTAGRDQFRQDLTKAEELIQKLQLVVKERDELKVQLKSRIAERDQVVGQYEQFRNTVREVVGQADAAALRFPNGELVTINLSLPRHSTE